ncbi:hypothetical protein D4764_22G0001030, partial [Takifugu flavidus]
AVRGSRCDLAPALQEVADAAAGDQRGLGTSHGYLQQVPLLRRNLVREDAAQEEIKGSQETQRAPAVHVQAVTGSWNLDEVNHDSQEARTGADPSAIIQTLDSAELYVPARRDSHSEHLSSWLQLRVLRLSGQVPEVRDPVQADAFQALKHSTASMCLRFNVMFGVVGVASPADEGISSSRPGSRSHRVREAARPLAERPGSVGPACRSAVPPARSHRGRLQTSFGGRVMQLLRAPLQELLLRRSSQSAAERADNLRWT